ncbi:MAG: vWA domain-containing protein [Lactimicrobium sp.]|jgi:hypothetical protein|uniref:vWA domain-containing protein n=1 Tax=Lactimicrobium sp. TaxID=2563780 RepID=UPI002F354924
MSEMPKEKCEALLAEEERMLTAFSGDQRLMYEVSETQETFVLLPEQQKVIVPLAFFQENGLDESALLYHLYSTLALYPDEQKYPSLYLKRTERFEKECEEITSCYLQKVSSFGLQDDPGYAPSIVYASVQNALSAFLDVVDVWTSDLLVQMKAPVYREAAMKKKIGKMLLLEGSFPEENSDVRTHEDLGGALLQVEYYGTDSIQNPQLKGYLQDTVLGMERYAFLRHSVLQIQLDQQGIQARDDLFQTFLLPGWVMLFKGDISRMKLAKTASHSEQSTPQKSAKKVHGPAMQAEDKKAMLKQLESHQMKKSAAAKTHGQRELEAFGVQSDDISLFTHYERKVQPARAKMKQFWQKLFGEAGRQISVRQTGQSKGYLDVDELIVSWCDFVEAQQKQNYKDLRIFANDLLVSVPKVLPQYLDISFVIDNSGSMRSGKLESAREALAIVLLSLQDFQQFLDANAAKTHQQTKVQIETWLFGSGSHRVMSFDDAGFKKKADTMLSVTRLRGDGGSTDDGACLQEVLKQITPIQEREIAGGNRIRLLFEVTDGASSFPGSAKKTVEKLKKKGVEIQAIEIGPDDPEARRIFDFIFGDHGTFLGTKADDLPTVLMGAVAKQMVSIFRRTK